MSREGTRPGVGLERYDWWNNLVLASYEPLCINPSFSAYASRVQHSPTFGCLPIERALRDGTYIRKPYHLWVQPRPHSLRGPILHARRETNILP